MSPNGRPDALGSGAAAPAQAVLTHAAAVRHTARPLLLGWLVLLLYASWFPLSGWRWPAGSTLAGLLVLPWPRWRDAFDVVANLVGYVPLGALLAMALVRGRRSRAAVWAWATACASALSYGLEVGQSLLPQRVPSMLDWLLNSAGATAGAAMAGWIARLGSWRWLQRTGAYWLTGSGRSGLALLALWPLGLLFPTPVVLGLGQVWAPLAEWIHDAADRLAAVAPWLQWLYSEPLHETRLSAPAEMLAVALGLLGPCLLMYSMAQRGLRRAWLVGMAAALAFGVTTLSTALNFSPQHALAWCTATSVAGLLLGGVLALLALRSAQRTAAALGLVVITAGLALVAQAPADPYYAQSLHDWEQGRFIRFHGLAQWIGWAWPYLAMAWLLRKLLGRE